MRRATMRRDGLSMAVCKKSGRIVTAAKSLVTLWYCDILLRTFRLPHHEKADDQTMHRHRRR